MLTELYIEALLVDEEVADQVLEAWNTGEIKNIYAFQAWFAVAQTCQSKVSLAAE